MRPPPALRVECHGDAPLWRGMHAGVVGAAGASAMAWAGNIVGLDHGATLVGVCLFAVMGAAMGWRAGRQPAGVLQWDGARWQWMCGATSPAIDLISVAVNVDLNAALLLKLTALPGERRAPRWLVLQRRADPAAWSALCATLYSPASRREARAS